MGANEPFSDAAPHSAEEDAATFGMDGAASQGDISVEVTRTNSRKMMMVWLLVGAISAILVACVGVSLVGWAYFSRTPETKLDGVARKKELPPPKEMKARLKNIDRAQGTLRLLVGDGKYQTFRVTDSTEFRDQAGLRLPQGIESPELREEDLVTILPTDDRQALQWLKLGAP